MKIKNSSCFLLSFLILFFLVARATSQELMEKSPSGDPEMIILGPTGMPGLGGLHGSDAVVSSIDGPESLVESLAEGEEKIILGDTGAPGLGGLSGANPLMPMPVSDPSISESSEPLGDTGKPGLGGNSGANI